MRKLSGITVNPKICHGKLVIAGTRIMVYQILELLEAGKTFDEIIENYFPDLTKEDMQACIHFARDILDEKRSLLSLGGIAKGRAIGVGNERDYIKKVVSEKVAKEGLKGE